MRGSAKRLARRFDGGHPAWEVHVPISPTEVFLLRVRMLAASLRRFGEIHFRLVVTVSRDVEPYDLHVAQPWSAAAGVEWRWVDQQLWDRHHYWGTAINRFLYVFDAPSVLMLDADVLCSGALDALPQLIGNGVGGVTDWVTPMWETPTFRDGRERSAPEMWRDLFRFAGLPDPVLDEEHWAWRITSDGPENKYAPRYFNHGVLAGSAKSISRLGCTIITELETVERFMDSRLRLQLAVPLAAARTETQLVSLPLRFNHPNSPWVWDAYLEQHDVRIVHYVEREVIDREALASAADIEHVVARAELSGVNAVLRDRFAAILPSLRDESS